MQASTTLSKKKRPGLAGNPGFVVHASLLGAFVGLVGYIAVICHHAH